MTLGASSTAEKKGPTYRGIERGHTQVACRGGGRGSRKKGCIASREKGEVPNLTQKKKKKLERVRETREKNAHPYERAEKS